MLEVSSNAAVAIAEECKSRDLPEAGGLRLYAQSADGSPASLAIEFIPEPRPGDNVLTEGDARVFVAENVERAVRSHVLDVKDDDPEKHLRLRRR
jgi:iron-sulfur cluster assembly protein